MSGSYTCITCQVLFKNPELQREHYKSDWHRYNLKRKVASISPVTLEEFDQRVQEHRQSAQESARDESQYCKFCSKLFNTKNAYSNHLNSKKHKQSEEQFVESKDEEQHSNTPDSDSFVKLEAEKKASAEAAKFVVVNAAESGDEDIETDSEIEEVRK